MKINIKEIIDEMEKEQESQLDEEQESNPKPEEVAEIEPDTGIEPESEIEDEPESEKTAEEEPEPENENEAEAEPETEHDAEPETKAEQETENVEQVPESKEPFFKKYGELFAIAAAFVVLFAVTFFYTEMIPREVSAVIDGKEQQYTTTAWTVEEFLNEENISYCEEDFVSMPVEGFIRDGLELEMIHAYDYKITADGETLDYKTLKKTVAEALEEEGVKINDLDIVEPGLNKSVKDGMTIVVKRVVIKEKTLVEKIPYKVIKKDDPNMNEGETKVVQKGKNGKAKVTYKITYIDGKESKRIKVKTIVVTPKTNKIVKEGTRVTIDGFAYTRKLVVKAYSYTGGGTTAMGTPARVGEIAVDPRVIPLGSKVYIEGVGVRYAEDTGGNIKGNTIDIYMNTLSECRSWGVRYVTIYIE